MMLPVSCERTREDPRVDCARCEEEFIGHHLRVVVIIALAVSVGAAAAAQAQVGSTAGPAFNQSTLEMAPGTLDRFARALAAEDGTRRAITAKAAPLQEKARLAKAQYEHCQMNLTMKPEYMELIQEPMPPCPVPTAYGFRATARSRPRCGGAITGALGCRQAVALDGGISAQLALRDASGAWRTWRGWRRVPLALVAFPRPERPDR